MTLASRYSTKVILFLLFLLCGGAGTLSAEEYIYYVVRADGNQKLYMKKTADPTDGIAMPEEIQVAYIPATDNPDGYRFFTTAAAALAYSKDHTAARTNEITAGTAYNNAGLTNKSIYVGYYYDKSKKPGDLPELDGVSYYQVNNSYDNSGTATKHWLYSNSNDKGYGCWATTASTDDAYLWAYGGNDPYAIKVLNAANWGKQGYVQPMSSGYWLELESSKSKDFVILGSASDTNGYNLGELNLKDDGTYNQTYGNRFMAFLTENSDGQYQYVRTNGGINSSSAEVFCSIDKTSKLEFTYVKTIANRITRTFKVINKSGVVAITITKAIEAGDSDAITIPDEIRSPYMPADASYRFYKNTDTDKAKTFADGNITTFGESDDVILVGYNFSSSSIVPDGLPKLDGATEYFVSSIETGQFLDSSVGYCTTETGDKKEMPQYKWKFGGGYDPYAISLISVGKNNQNVSVQLGCGNSRFIGYNSTSATPFFILGTSPDNLNLAYVNNSGNVGGSTYLCFLVDVTKRTSATPSIPDPKEIFRTNNSSYSTYSTNIYTSAFTEANLKFELANPSQTYTYHIINGSNVEAATYTEEQSIGDAPHVPDAIRSPLLGDDAYFYYTAQDRNTKLAVLPEEGGDVWVDYNWDESPLLDLYGKTAYNLVADGTKYLVGITSDQAEAAASDNMLWTLEGATPGDPYDIKLINYTSTAGSAEDRAAKRRQLVKDALGDGNLELVTAAGGEAVQTFYLTYYKGNASGTKYTLAPVGNKVGTSEEYYVQYEGNQLKLTQTSITAQTDGTGLWLQPQVYKFKYKYTLYGGVNGDGGIVATATSHTPTVKLPRRISSPLLKKYDYEDEGAGAAIAEGAELEWKDYQFRVTYDYTNDDYRNADMSIDLTGTFQYLISDRVNYRPYDLDTGIKAVTLAKGDNNPKSPTEAQILGDEDGTKTIRWSLKGNDPYDIEIVNTYAGYSAYSVVADTKATGTTDYKQASATKHPLKLVTDAASGSYAVKRFALVYDNDVAGNAYTTDGSATPTDLHFALMVPGEDTDGSANFVRSYGPTTNYDNSQNYVEVVNIPVDDTESYYQMNYVSGGNRWGGTIFLWKAQQRRNYTLHMTIQGEPWETTYANKYVDDPITFPTTWPLVDGTGTYHYYTDAAMTNESEVTTYPSSDATTIDLYVKYEFESWGDIKFVNAEDLDTTTDWFFIIMSRTDLYGAGHKDMPVRSKDGQMKFYGPDMMATEYDFDDLFTNPMKVSRSEGRSADVLGLTDEYLWAFVGDPYNVRLYNKATQTYLALKTGTNDNVDLKAADASGYTFDWVLHPFFNKANEGYAPSKADNAQFSLYWKNTSSGYEWGLTSYNSQFTSRPATTTTAETYFHREQKTNSPMFSFKAFRYIETVYQDVTFILEDSEGTEIDRVTVSKDDRQYAVGDIVTTDAEKIGTYDGVTGAYHQELPLVLKRKYCDYTFYDTTADLVARSGGEVEKTIAGGTGGQEIHVAYETSALGRQIFMPEGVQPSSAAGQQYIFFMDSGTGKDAASNIMNNHWYVASTEKVWCDVESGTAEMNQSLAIPGYTSNRFSVDDPKRLRFYFRGDPYHTRVFATENPEQNLAPMTRQQAYNIERNRYRVQFGTTTTSPTETNSGSDFIWQMMDSQSDEELSFSLCFKQGLSPAVTHGTEGTFSERQEGAYYYLCRNRGVRTEESKEALGQSYGPTTLQLDYNFETSTDDGGNTIVSNATTKVKGTIMHTANGEGSALVLRRPALVEASVYKETDLSTPVTQREKSEYYAVSERFQSLPSNIRRKFCDYTLIDPSTKATLANQNAWFEVTIPEYEGTIDLAAKYTVQSDAPFAATSLADVESLWNDENTVWLNMAISGQYAYFDRNYGGLDGQGQDNDYRVIQGGSTPLYHKGAHWAFVGDPYEFYIVNRRHQSFTFDELNYKQVSTTPGYLSASLLGSGAKSGSGFGSVAGMVDSQSQWTAFTFMLNPQNNNYYLSQSSSRKSGYAASYYNMNHSWVNDGSAYNGYKANPTTYYTYGENVSLKTVSDDWSTKQSGLYGAPADNEAFDCIVNVYNGENKIVATSGWTELPHNAEGTDLVPTELRRYGCNYKVWGDATMTANEITNYSQVTGNAVTLFVTYTYNDQLYSSENELRWVNCYFKWDYAQKEPAWRKTPHVHYRWTDTDGTYGDANQQYDRYGDRWDSYLKPLAATEKVGWMYSPYSTGTNTAYGSIGSLFADKDEARASLKEGGANPDAEKYDGMKWALIGDPYEFQLKSFHWLDGDYTYYYLKTDGTISHQKEDAINNGAITDDTPVDQTFQTELTAEQKQGFTYTYKVDDNGRGYLALKDELDGTGMIKSTAETKLIGTVKSYLTFSRENATEGTESLLSGYTYQIDGVTYTKGMVYTIADTDYEASFGGKTFSDVTHNGITTTAAQLKTLEYDQQQYPFTDEKGGEVEGRTYAYGEQDATAQNLRTVTAASVVTMNQSPEKVDGIKEWYVEPMDEYAREVVFRLHVYQKDKDDDYHRAQQIYSSYADDAIAPYVSKPTSDSGLYNEDMDNEPYKLTLAEGEEYPVTLRDLSDDGYYQFVPYTIEDYGVGNNLLLPWSYRRQYCDYYYKAVKVEQAATFDASGKVTAWTDVTSTVLADGVQRWYKRLDKRFNNYRVTFDVFYKTQDAFQASTSADDAWWYDLGTQETLDLDAMRMQFKYSDNIHTAGNDRAKYNTDDWLWAVEGDPYGFKMHNRYARTWDEVLTVPTIPAPVDVSETVDEQTGEATFNGTFTTITADPISRGSYVTMQQEDGTKTGNQYFEMMVGNYGQSFLFHPLGATIIDRYPAFFLTMFVFNSGSWPTQLNEMQDRNAKRNIAANWSLESLSAQELLPYYDRAGHVGALTVEQAAANSALFGRLKSASHTRGDLKAAQRLVHDADNLVQLTDGNGYYRLLAWSEAYDGYYLAGPHTKRDADGGIGTALHLRRDGVSVSEVNRLTVGSNESREKEYALLDPASVVQFKNKTAGTDESSQQWEVWTQGVDINTGKTLRLDPIGVGAFTLRSADAMTGQYAATDGLHLSDNAANELAEDARGEMVTAWTIQPVGTAAVNTAGNTCRRPLGLRLNLGTYNYRKYYFASICVPYDLAIDGDSAIAYTGNRTRNDAWSQEYRVQCDSVPEVTVGSETYDRGRFIPAGSAVLIRAQDKNLATQALQTMTDSDGKTVSYLTFTMPTDAPAADAAFPYNEANRNNYFRGKYLEQTLTDTDGPADDEYVYVFGQATATDYATATMTDVGLYVNKNTTDGSRNYDSRDNRYVRHNKLYYIDKQSKAQLAEKDVDAGSGARTRIGVSFDDRGVEELHRETAEGRPAATYDLRGVRVSDDDRELQPGVYIRNGKKIIIRQQ